MTVPASPHHVCGGKFNPLSVSGKLRFSDNSFTGNEMWLAASLAHLFCMWGHAEETNISFHVMILSVFEYSIQFLLLVLL